MGDMTPETFREKLRDCWYFTSDGCKCLWCEHKHPGHSSDCPATHGLAAADAWEAERFSWSKDAWEKACRAMRDKDARIEALKRWKIACKNLAVATGADPAMVAAAKTPDELFDSDALREAEDG